jgi:hypothetical protein
VSKIVGVELTLAAIGFEFVCEPKQEDKDSSAIAAAEAYEQKYPALESILQSLVSDDVDDLRKDALIESFIRSVLHPPSAPAIIEMLRFASAIDFKLNIVMNEPLVDSSSLDGFQVWIDWFDKVKLNAEAIESFKQTLV